MKSEGDLISTAISERSLQFWTSSKKSFFGGYFWGQRDQKLRNAIDQKTVCGTFWAPGDNLDIRLKQTDRSQVEELLQFSKCSKLERDLKCKNIESL